MFSDTFNTISSAPVGRWKDSLTSRDLVTLETIDRPQMRAMQYTPSDSKLGSLPIIDRMKVIQKTIKINLKELVNNDQ